jgi:hypothetical protein
MLQQRFAQALLLRGGREAELGRVVGARKLARDLQADEGCEDETDGQVFHMLDGCA